MTNLGKKGTRLERQALEELEKDGWRVHRTVRNPIFSPQKGFVGSHNNDVFGAFDLVAAKRDAPLAFIQVTVGDAVGARQAKVETVADSFPDEHCRVEVWGWVGGAKRLNKNFTRERRYIRRQYWRRLLWRNYVPDEFGPGWVDLTNPNAGWEDHGGVAPGGTS